MEVTAETRQRSPALTLSLQFSRDEVARAHRQVLTRGKVSRFIRAALAGEAADQPAEITVRVVGAEEGRTLNLDYRGKDYATNVLTFDYSRSPLCADLVLCAPVIAREAQQLGVALEAHYAHLLVHGTLHAQGHDHEIEPQAEAMESLETRLVTALGYPDPYAARVTD